MFREWVFRVLWIIGFLRRFCLGELVGLNVLVYMEGWEVG